MDKNVAVARAVFYRLWRKAVTFGGRKNFSDLVELVHYLQNYAFDAHTQRAWGNMAAFLARGEGDFYAEQNAVFFAPGAQSVPLEASFYSFSLPQKTRLKAAEIARTAGLVGERGAEDGVEFLCAMMGAFLREIAVGAPPAQWEILHRRVFVELLCPMGEGFVARLQNHKKSVFYADFACVLAAFLHYEKLFFGLA